MSEFKLQGEKNPAFIFILYLTNAHYNANEETCQLFSEMPQKQFLHRLQQMCGCVGLFACALCCTVELSRLSVANCGDPSEALWVSLPYTPVCHRQPPASCVYSPQVPVWHQSSNALRIYSVWSVGADVGYTQQQKKAYTRTRRVSLIAASLQAHGRQKRLSPRLLVMMGFNVPLLLFKWVLEVFFCLIRE